MGKIDDSIMENYKKALNDGDLLQASKAVKLAKSLKWLIESENFVDYPSAINSATVIVGSVFKPFPYKYFPESGILVVTKITVNLTATENKLFYFFTQNETHDDNIRIIKTEEIKKYLWPNSTKTNNAVRILIKRLRRKIEPDPYSPQIVLNFNKKGYIFVAQREW